MKKLLCLLALAVALPIVSLGQDFTIIESDSHHLSLRFELNEFSIDTVRRGGELMHVITTKGITVPNDYGEPDLPTFNRFVAIPQGAQAIIEVRPSRGERISGINIAPSVGSQCENETERPFYKEPKYYERDAMYPSSAVVMAEPQKMRGVDVVHLGISPVQFNPERHEITVNRQFDIDIRFEGGNGHFGDDRLRSPYWDPILQNNILNYDALPSIDYHARRQAWLQGRPTGCEYLIITPDNDPFVEAAQELADYRTRQGIITKVMNISEAGISTPGMLRLWIRSIYSNWDIPPAAVCLLGDHGDNYQQYIPAFRTQHPKDGFISSDNPYADIDDDELPDICFSRLVAQNPTELPIFIGKLMEYEYSNPCMNPYYYLHPLTASAWQTSLWFQITISTIYGHLSQHGKQPTRLSEIHTGELSDQWSSASGTSTITSYFGPEGLGYIPATPGELGGWTGARAEHVIRAINQGAYLIQHRDHGWTTKWYQPEIYTTDFGEINNVGKMPFLISVNCKTGQFDHTSNCFVEALLRMTREGQNAGIVGAIGPSGQTYSFANDIFLWGIWDLFDPAFLPDYGPYDTQHTGLWMPAFAAVAGKYFLETNVFPGTNETMRSTTYNTFHAHCDPFIKMYTEMPQAIEATYDPTFTSYAPFHFTVPEGIDVALSAYYGGKAHLLATATGTGEQQTFQVMSYVPVNRVKLTMTGQNYLRREETIVVMPFPGPAVATDSIAVNGDVPQLAYGESAVIDLNVKNVGSEASPAGTAVLSCGTGQMQINQSQSAFGALSPDESQLIENAFRISMGDNLPDWTEVPFTITTQFGGESLERNYTMTVKAPHFAAELIGISDPLGNNNGRLEPGELATLNFRVTNIGHCVAENPTFALSNDQGYIRVITPEITLHDVGIYHVNDISFDIFVEFIAGESTSVDIGIVSTSRSLVEETHFNIPIGFTVETFEDHYLNPEYWTNDPYHPWILSNTLPQEGSFCLRSGVIDHNQTSAITFTYTSNVDGELTFYRKVSSETNYDFLVFRIDDEVMDRWSGVLPWFHCGFPVSAGTHTYTWSYEKDHSMTNGDDCAFIDYISLPPFLDKTDEQNEHALTIHPNPTTDLVWIDIEQEGDYVVNVYDGKGKLIMSKRNDNKLSFSKMAAGIYHIEVVQNGQRWSRKMVKM